MIAKEIDPFKTQHNYEEAAFTAMQLISEQLKRHFMVLPNASEYNLRILNALRLESKSYVVQFDHLILHKYGIILVENRGEPADLFVNKLDEWTQHYKGAELRIPSPINQGERKLKQLIDLLERNRKILRPTGKNQAGFRSVKARLLVAVSNEGTFKTSPGMSLDSVCRVSDIANKVYDCILEQKKASKRPLFSRKDPESVLLEEELFKVTGFLRTKHSPLERPEIDIVAEAEQTMATKPSSESSAYIENERSNAAEKLQEQTAGPDLAEENKVVEEKVIKRSYLLCEQCGSSELFVNAETHYEVVCMDCKNSERINQTCTNCGEKGFISKADNEYLVECKACLSAEFIEIMPVR